MSMSGTADGGDGQATGAGTGQVSGGAGGGQLPSSQEELNALMAGNKKGLQREVADLRAKLQQHEALKGQVEELLGGRPFEELAPLLEETTTSLKSAQEQLKVKEQQHEKKLKDALTRAEQAELGLTSLKIDRSLSEALADKASTPAARQHLIDMAAKRAKVTKEGQVEVEMEFEEDGVKVRKGVPPAKAIELMEADVANFGPFFKATVASGTGSAVGGEATKKMPNGTVDVRGMDMDTYAKLRETRPELFGLNG